MVFARSFAGVNQSSNNRLVFLSVVPSPYQRDVFTALAERGHVGLQVHYLERAAPDSPWPAPVLAKWEHVLPGFTLGRGRWRSHVNWALPMPQAGETWVVNGAMTDLTTQRIMRILGRHGPWCFWGELPSVPQTRFRRWVQARQYAPLRTAFAIVAVGERARSAYQRLVPGVPVFNQPYACRLDHFAAAASARTTADEPAFLFCGQMIARKGIDILLQAFDRLVGDGVRARLDLIGREAELPGLLARVAPTTRERIHYHGFKAPHELPTWFARADIFVLPSRHDGWGVVVNQALAAGLPVIATHAVGAAHDLVEPEVNGLLIPASDPIALATAMRRLAQSRDLRERFGAAAYRRAERLTPEHSAEFWEDIVANLSPSG